MSYVGTRTSQTLQWMQFCALITSRFPPQPACFASSTSTCSYTCNWQRGRVDVRVYMRATHGGVFGPALDSKAL